MSLMILARHYECIEDEDGFLYDAVFKYVWHAEKRQWKEYLYAQLLYYRKLLNIRWITPELKESMKIHILHADKLKIFNGREVKI